MSAFYIYVDDIRKCPYSDDDRFIIFTARTYNKIYCRKSNSYSWILCTQYESNWSF